MAKPVGADFTLVYDDQSYDAPDLRSDKGQDDENTIALIRGKFKFAARDALEILRRESCIFPTWVANAQFHPLRLVSLTEFLAQPVARPSEPYLGLPVLITAVSFLFVDMADEKKDDASTIRAIYYSPTVFEQMQRLNQMIRQGHKKNANELSASNHGDSFALIPGLLRNHPMNFAAKMYRQVDQFLTAKYGFPRPGPYAELLFVNAEDKSLRTNNKESISNTISDFMYKSEKNLFQGRNLEASAALQQIITQGLADDAYSSPFSQFLTKGLYDPRLFLFVDDYLNRKKED